MPLSCHSSLIRYACRLRRKTGHVDTAHPLDLEELNRRLRHKISHNLTALVIELDAHLAALDLDPLDPETPQHIEAVVEVDEKGMSFRYASQLPTAPQRSDGGHPQIRLDFPSLRQTFATRYETLTGLFTVLELREDAFDF